MIIKQQSINPPSNHPTTTSRHAGGLLARARLRPRPPRYARYAHHHSAAYVCYHLSLHSTIHNPTRTYPPTSLPTPLTYPLPDILGILLAKDLLVVDHGALIPVDTFLRFFGRPIEVRITQCTYVLA